MAQKMLLVGDPRICPQVAYVMDWSGYEQTERLTEIEHYRDYKIVVCAFKRKSKKLASIKDKTLNIIFLDDICRALDQKENEQALTINPQQTNPMPLWRRVLDRIKTGDVKLAVIRRVKRYFTLRSFAVIKRLPIESLRLSELFIKVLYSQPTNISCNHLLTWGVVDYKQNLNGCCTEWVPPFGNLACANLPALYNSYRSRIIKLSAINRSYCLCNLVVCENAKYLATTELILDN